MTTAQARVRDELDGLIDRHRDELVALRRDLHRHPELMFEERRTATLIAERLAALGIEHRPGLAAPEPGAEGTGIVAFLPGTEPGADDRPAVALRADMDALPIDELTGVAHASTRPGLMHACGHDGHTTILAGVASVLAGLSRRPNHVVFLFQPAEEGGAGGEKMCRDGALDGSLFGGDPRARVGRVFGLHGWPSLPVGTIATRPGPILAATDDFTVTIRGVGGHAAMPHLTRDPVVCGAAVVQALQTLASRTTAPTDAIVCTVACFHAGRANNVIPDEAVLEGTVRTLRDDTRAVARDRFHELVRHVASAHGCAAEIGWDPGYPVTRNDPALASEVLAIASDVLGPDRASALPAPFLGGEDFSYYGRHAAACFMLLGLLPEGGDPDTTPLLHQATFDFNDDAIPAGVRMMASLALA